jgi:hypothetical protein
LWFITSGGRASRISSARSRRPAEVRREDLDARLRRKLPHRADAIDEVPGAAVAKVVAIDAG